MARILLTVPSRHTNLHFALSALAAAGHEVTVLSADPVTSGEIPGVSHHVLGREPEPSEVARRLDPVPDVILLRKSWGLGRAVLQQARLGRVVVLGYEVRPMTDIRPWTSRLKLRLRGRPTRRVTPVRGLDRTAPVDRASTYLPWPVAADPKALAQARDIGDLPLQILCVGKLAQTRKNQILLLDAMRPLGEAGLARLTFAGFTGLGASGTDAAYIEDLRQAARTLAWVDIAGDLPFAQMPAIYAAHHVCVLPAVREVIGVAPVEGMAYGTIPIISTDAGSAGYLTHGVDGYRIDPTDTAALMALLRGLAEDPALRARLSAGARRTAETELSPAAFLARIDTLLAGLRPAAGRAGRGS